MIYCARRLTHKNHSAHRHSYIYRHSLTNAHIYNLAFINNSYDSEPNRLYWAWTNFSLKIPTTHGFIMPSTWWSSTWCQNIGIIRKCNRISGKTHLMIHKWFAFRNFTSNGYQSKPIYIEIDTYISEIYWDSKPIHLWHCVKQLGVIFEKRSDYLPIFYPAQKLLSSCTMD